MFHIIEKACRTRGRLCRNVKTKEDCKKKLEISENNNKPEKARNKAKAAYETCEACEQCGKIIQFENNKNTKNYYFVNLDLVFFIPHDYLKSKFFVVFFLYGRL